MDVARIVFVSAHIICRKTTACGVRNVGVMLMKFGSLSKYFSVLMEYFAALLVTVEATVRPLYHTVRPTFGNTTDYIVCGMDNVGNGACPLARLKDRCDPQCRSLFRESFKSLSAPICFDQRRRDRRQRCTTCRREVHCSLRLRCGSIDDRGALLVAIDD